MVKLPLIDGYYRAIVTVENKPQVKYSKSESEALSIRSGMIEEAKKKGKYVFDRKSRSTKGQTIPSTWPLIKKNGCPSFLTVLLREKNSDNSIDYFIQFRVGQKNGGSRKRFKIKNDDFDAAFLLAFNYGVSDLSLNQDQRKKWLSGKSNLHKKYLELKK